MNTRYLYAPQVEEMNAADLETLVASAALMTAPHYDTADEAIAAGAEFAQRLGATNRAVKVTFEIVE